MGNKDLKSSSSLPLHAQGRRRTVLKRHCFGLFSFFVLFLKRMKTNLGVTQKWVMTVAPLFTMLTKQKKLLNALHSKLVKKKTKMVYFPGRPAHTLTLVYFQGRPAHTRSQWSIFTGDLPTQTHTGIFSWATCPHTLTLVLVYFHGLLAQAYSKWSIFRGDQPTHSHLP